MKANPIFAETRWTMWNHVRTGAAIVAALPFSLGLMQNG